MKAWASLAGGAVLVVAIGGVLHLPVARPALAWLAQTTGCPVSLDGGDAASLEAHRLRHVRTQMGKQRAASSAVFGFSLGRTSKLEVASALAGEGAECRPRNDDAVIRCRLRPAAEAGELDAHLQFDSQERLVAIDVWYPAENGDAAVDRFSRRSEAVSAAVGPATSGRGVLDAGRLQRRTFSRVETEFAYADHLARLSVTNLGRRGVRVREQHQWIPGA